MATDQQNQRRVRLTDDGTVSVPMHTPPTKTHATSVCTFMPAWYVADGYPRAVKSRAKPDVVSRLWVYTMLLETGQPMHETE